MLEVEIQSLEDQSWTLKVWLGDSSLDAYGGNRGGRLFWQISCSQDIKLIATQSIKGKETDWVNPREQRFFPLQISGQLPTTGLCAGFEFRYKLNCSPISGDTPGVETSPEKRMPEKMTAPLFVKDLH